MGKGVPVLEQGGDLRGVEVQHRAEDGIIDATLRALLEAPDEHDLEQQEHAHTSPEPPYCGNIYLPTNFPGFAGYKHNCVPEDCAVPLTTPAAAHTEFCQGLELPPVMPQHLPQKPGQPCTLMRTMPSSLSFPFDT